MRERLALFLIQLGRLLHPQVVRVAVYIPPREISFEDAEAAEQGAAAAFERATRHWQNERQAEKMLWELRPELCEDMER
ncbi:hypothetical protein TK90_2644 (plasmid) [Thioalkalivibrio sp. K90mix]|uniref:hypothetical protein n=1 Tax=Thioalkalivibrio sp. (strain K90mix) TaxID=396595 RepID=UPI000195ABA0|nr:hypothetical protein [Thioalkalivibrio sp. K90mix]ADC73131.1 hypothetical protein TK90_2644 [Thioalkalivibrio sp. K90mix]